MKTIKLTQGKVALVDDSDYEYLNQWKWCAHKDHNMFYASRSFRGKTIIMHRVIMNAKKGELIDHRDRYGLNNQRGNLRFCTCSQNAKNKISHGTSKYLGVCLHKISRKWQADIVINNRKKYLGSYACEKDAAKAYNKAALKYHEEFANLNLI